MNALDLDALRARWTESNRALNDSLSLDRDAVSRALAGRTAAAFRRHSMWLMPSIVTAAAALGALIWFIAGHLHDPLYLSIACVLALFAFAELTVNTRQWLTLARLDFTQPALEIQKTLDELRARRLRLTQWIMLTSVLLWLPLIALLLKALAGFDLMRQLDSSVVLINLVVGVLFIPLALVVGRFALPRLVGKTGVRRFLDEAVGISWTSAQRHWQRQQQIHNAPNSAPPAHALMAELAAPLRVINRRLMLGILTCAGFILSIGWFNAAHGGQWQFLAAGVVLNLLFVSQMVVRILHRLQLNRMRDEMPNPTELAQHLNEAAAMREKLARVTMALLPLLALAGSQVLGKWVFDIDVFNALDAPVKLMLGLAALALGFGLWLSARRNPAGLLARLAIAMAGTSTRMTRALSAEFVDEGRPSSAA